MCKHAPVAAQLRRQRQQVGLLAQRKEQRQGRTSGCAALTADMLMLLLSWQPCACANTARARRHLRLTRVHAKCQLAAVDAYSCTGVGSVCCSCCTGKNRLCCAQPSICQVVILPAQSPLFCCCTYPAWPEVVQVGECCARTSFCRQRTGGSGCCW